MADPLVHFSCLLDAGSPANASRALDVYVALSEDDTHPISMREAFRLSIEPDHGPSQLWMRDEGGGDPETVIRFALVKSATDAGAANVRAHARLFVPFSPNRAKGSLRPTS